MNLIETKNLSVKFGAQVALSKVNFNIHLGEIITLVGPNGSGKSTFLRSVIGAVKPSEGTITLQPKLRIGYVPQRLYVDPTLPLTVERFLNLPSRMSQKDSQKALEQANAGNLSGRQMAKLSGGEFQRALLARALLRQPQLLILDEATQGLDHLGAAFFYRQIEEVRQRLGCAVLMASHELHVVMAASDRVVCLNKHVCCQGAPEHVVSAPEYQALFGTGAQGALAIYRHQHNHRHDHA